MAAPVLTRRQKPPSAIDRGWAWMIVLGVFIYVFIMVGLAKSYGLFLLAFLKHFDITTAEAALPVSISAFVYAIGAPTAIMVAEITSPQKVVLVGACVGFVGLSLSSVLVSMGYVIFFYGVCVGIGNSCFYGNGLIMISKYFRQRRSLATGLGLAGASIGQFVLPPVIEYLLETYHLSGTLLIVAALYFHCAISGALFRPFDQCGPVEERAVETVESNGPQPKGREEEEEEKEALVTSNPEEIVSTEDMEELSRKEAGNGDVSYFPVNGNAGYKEGKTYIPSHDVNNGHSNKIAQEEQTLVADPETKRKSQHWSEIIEEEEEIKFFQRKALLASTGSIFLVSPSILDVSDIDHRAHGVNNVAKKPATGIKRLFDFSILRSLISCFFIVVSFFCFFGYFNFILFLPAIFEEKGVTSHKAMLISVCGAGDLIARIGTGLVADKNFIPRYQLKAIACLLCGINIFVVMFANTFVWLAFHCFLYGFLGGVYVCLMSVVLVDFVGVQLMAKNLAIILLLQGMGAALGQIFMGWIKDVSGTFNYVILLCAASMLFGGVLLFGYPIVKRWEDARLARKYKDVAYK